MNYKVKSALEKSKKALILVVILWVVLSIVLVSPIAVSIVEATENRGF
jgi:hypothetical protein